MSSYGLTLSLFFRGLAFVHVCAFASLFPQIPALLGPQGLYPYDALISRVPDTSSEFNVIDLPFVLTDSIKLFRFVKKFIIFRYFEVPHESLSGEMALQLLCFLGIVGGLINWIFHVKILRTFILFANLQIYSLFISSGIPFFHFQWDILLIQVTFLALLLSVLSDFSRRFPGMSPSNSITTLQLMMIYVLRLVMAKFMIVNGLVKLQSDCPTWWGLTTLRYHFQGQPLASPLSWYAHHLPDPILKLGVLHTLIIEIIAPIALILPFREVRLFCGITQILLQILIMATGNYNFFNILTLVLNITSFDDTFILSMTPGWFLNICCCMYYPRSRLCSRYAPQSHSGNYLIKWFNYLIILFFIVTVIYFSNSALTQGLPFTQKQFHNLLESSYFQLAVKHAFYLPIILFIIEVSWRHFSSIPSLLSLRPKIAVQNALLTIRLAFVLLMSLTLMLVLVQAQYHTFWQSLSVDRTLITEKEFSSFVPKQINSPHLFQSFKEVEKRIYMNNYSNSYGLFRRITGVEGRPQLILEGSDGELKNGKLTWKTYDFFHKPVSLKQMPTQVAPHQPRIDWQIWFTALREDLRYDQWIQLLFEQLSRQSPPVLAQFKKNPFPEKPPQFIRLRRFIYTFTEPNQNSSNWWKRSYDKTVLPKTPLKQYSNISELGLGYKRVDIKEYRLWKLAEQWVQVVILIFLSFIVNKFRLVQNCGKLTLVGVGRCCCPRKFIL